MRFKVRVKVGDGVWSELAFTIYLGNQLTKEDIFVLYYLYEKRRNGWKAVVYLRRGVQGY